MEQTAKTEQIIEVQILMKGQCALEAVMECISEELQTHHS